MLLLIAGAVGYLERRIGGLRAALVVLGTHLVSTVGAAVLVLGARGLGVPGASALADEPGTRDVGRRDRRAGRRNEPDAPDGAGQGPVGRRRLRGDHAGALRCAGRSGAGDRLRSRTDAGPLGGGARSHRADVRRRGRQERPEWRGSAAWRRSSSLLVPVTSVVLAVVPGTGGIVGLGAGSADNGHRLVAGLVQLGIALAIAKAVRRGLPGGWWAAVVFCAVPLAGAVAAVLTRQAAGHTLGDLACWATILAIFLAYRRLLAAAAAGRNIPSAPAAVGGGDRGVRRGVVDRVVGRRAGAGRGCPASATGGVAPHRVEWRRGARHGPLVAVRGRHVRLDLGLRAGRAATARPVPGAIGTDASDPAEGRTGRRPRPDGRDAATARRRIARLAADLAGAVHLDQPGRRGGDRIPAGVRCGDRAG